METLRRLYNRYRGFLENGIFIILLAFYPLLKINQGLDLADTSYSLANFLYFPSAEGTWMVATYLANVVGYLCMMLPKGDTLVGMNFYTGLILSAFVLLFYFTLRKKIPAWIVFIGEMLAVSLCWCPTVVLYHYLSYYLMGAGALLLYYGICLQEDKKNFWYFLTAGICLGANVTARMPNVVQAVFILALWYGAWLKKETFGRTVKDTAVCILGYLAGFGVPFVTICIKYGSNAYPEMVRELFAMTDKAVDYKPTSMLSGMFTEYKLGLFWMAFAAIVLICLHVLYVVKNRFLPQKFVWLYRIICIASCGLLVRFYWGRGMFNFEYYYYRSMYQWAVQFLLITVLCAAALLIGRKVTAEDKVLALLVLLILFVTPLGGNNDLYPIINNLFLIAPFTLWVCFDRFVATKGEIQHFSWKAVAGTFVIMLLIQSVGFHFHFVFQDSVWGEKRDTLLTGIPKTEGICTNRENAELFSELVQYAGEQQFSGREVILYGEIPGLSYFLDMPSAISTAWPDLESYRRVRFDQDLKKVELNMEKSRPVVIVSSAIAAYKDEDGEAYEWFGVDPEAYAADEKLGMLLQFLEDYDYEETFGNMRYVVYE